MSIAGSASTPSRKVDAQMLLDLDLLSDESFAANADGRRRSVAQDSEMLDELDSLEDDESEDPRAGDQSRRRR